MNLVAIVLESGRGLNLKIYIMNLLFLFDYNTLMSVRYHMRIFLLHKSHKISQRSTLQPKILIKFMNKALTAWEPKLGQAALNYTLSDH